LFGFSEREAGWYIPVIPALKRLRQGDCKFEARLGYIRRFSPLTQQNKERRRKEGRKRKKSRAVSARWLSFIYWLSDLLMVMHTSGGI
jgi:hypothetical protein